MKKIVCITCMSVISVFGYVSSYDFSDRSQSPDSPYAAQILEQSYENQGITSKKRNTFHKSKTPKKIKQTKQDFKDLDLYDVYCDNPDLFLTDLKKEGTNPSYINSMIYTLKKYNFFYASWPKSKIESVEQVKIVKDKNLRCDDSFWDYI